MRLALYVSGSLADRFSVKRVLVVGTLFTALLTAMFGLVGFLGSHDDADARRYAILWCLNGLVQSVGWPSNVKIMGNWFGQGHRGAVFGFWASCVSVGNILGSLLASAVLHNGLGWEWVFLFPSIIIGVWALAIQCLLPSNAPSTNSCNGARNDDDGSDCNTDDGAEKANFILGSVADSGRGGVCGDERIHQDGGVLAAALVSAVLE
jgi:sugar phosphate permease